VFVIFLSDWIAPSYFLQIIRKRDYSLCCIVLSFITKIICQKQANLFICSLYHYTVLRSSAACLLRLWVRIPPEAWMFVCSECCVLSGRGICDGLITRPEESYRLWRDVVCDLETSKTRKLKPATGL